jgi:four helix bundle suffix protein
MQTKSGYQNLIVYQIAVLLYDLGLLFCKRYLADYGQGLPTRRTQDQIIQALRSGKQNIVEGSLERSLKLNINLTGVSRASFGEALEDFKDYLRINDLELWDKNDIKVLEIRAIRITNQTNLSNFTNWTNSPETFCNLMVTLLSLETYLLDQMFRSLENRFITEGGYSENLFKKRLTKR